MSKTSLILPSGHPTSAASMHRRNFLLGAGATGMALGTALGTAYTQIATGPDYSLRIAPLRLELAPGKVIETFGYNGTVPGPVLRLREGRQVSIDIRNDTDVDDIVHWHGLYLPAAADGAMEEGSPMVERGGMQRYTFTARPSGTRWYHSHDVAGKDLTRSLYSGMYGFSDCRAGHRSRPLRPGSAAGRPPLGRLLGQHAGSPQRPAARQRPGGTVQVGILQRQDARPRRTRPRPRRRARAVPAAQRQPDPERHARASRPSLHRDRARRQSGAIAPNRRHAVSCAGGTGRRDRGDEPARRLDLGATRDEDRKMGLGVVVEYAGQRGEPQWSPPPSSAWDYTIFGADEAGAGARRAPRAPVRESAGRPRRLQPLDHQRQVLAGNQSAVHDGSSESAIASR